MSVTEEGRRYLSNDQVSLVLLLQVWLVEDDRNLLAVLSCQNQICRIGGEAEVLLNPNGLAGENQHVQWNSFRLDLLLKTSEADLCLLLRGRSQGLDFLPLLLRLPPHHSHGAS